MKNEVIRTFGLVKYYGRVRGIEGLNLEVQRGEIFGFLGPNGAGKTTTIRLLLGLLRPTKGRAEVFGLDVWAQSRAVRRRLGYIPGEVNFYSSMTGAGHLSLVDALRERKDASRRQELALRLDLDLSRPIRAYSHGMRQKLVIIQALMHQPDLLILDEPTAGLDPLMQAEFLHVLLEEKERGCTVFLSSHFLPEVEKVCDRVGIVKEGRLVATEEVEALKHKRVRRLELTLLPDAEVHQVTLPGARLVKSRGQMLEFSFQGNVAALLQVLAKLPLKDVAFPEATLEDTFLEYYS